MNKKIEFPGASREARKEQDAWTAEVNDRIKTALCREFPLPEQVKQAQQKAFEEIRNRAAREKPEAGGTADLAAETKGAADHRNGGGVAGEDGNEKEIMVNSKKGVIARKKHRKGLRIFGRLAAGVAAACLVFSVVCITNPTLAENIPVLGTVFGNLGRSMGFYQGFDQYAQVLEKETEVESSEADSGAADKVNSGAADEVNSGAADEADSGAADEVNSSAADEADSGAVDDDAAEEKTGEAGNQETADIAVGSEGKESGEAAQPVQNVYTTTSNGITVSLPEVYCNGATLYLAMQIRSQEPFPEMAINSNEEGEEYRELWLSVFDSQINNNPVFFGTSIALQGTLVDEYTFEGVFRLPASSVVYTGNAEKETDTFPDTFTVTMDFSQIVGDVPWDQRSVPDMPEEFTNEYLEGMAAQGLDPEKYDTFTEKEMEMESQLFNEMWQKYWERYPDVQHFPNQYKNWWYDGEWNYTLDVVKNEADTVIKEIDLTDQEGDGIQTITRSPFEITVSWTGANWIEKYWAVVLDAEGNKMLSGGFTDVDSWEVRNHDVSKVYVYLCDYTEYMDEIKGYFTAPYYEELRKTQSYKQFLDERAVLKTEVVFEE